MQRNIWWLIAVVALGLGSLMLYNAMRRPAAPPSAPSAPRAEAPPAPAPSEPQTQFPVPESPTPKPLPALEASDGAVQNALAALMPGGRLTQLAVFKNFVRHVVATVDTLPAQKLASRMIPVQPVSGSFAVSGSGERFSIAPANAARYTPYVQLAQALDSAKLVAFYHQHYPLFQQAYRDLGYPQGHFNDRLINVIDHLLAAPEVQAPVALVRPKVFYLYADSDLETRSAGHKILMRMGTENAARVKAKLREIRAEIMRQGAAATAARP